MWIGCASPVILATSHTSVEPFCGVSVAATPFPLEVDPGTRVVDPSRLPFHLVLLMRLSTGSPSAVGEPGPPLGSASSSTKVSCRTLFGVMDLMLTIGAARSAGCAPAGLKVVSGPENGAVTANCMTRPSEVASGAPKPTGPPLGKGRTAKFFTVKVLPACPAKSMMTSARSAGARNRQRPPARTSTLLPIGEPEQAFGP